MGIASRVAAYNRRYPNGFLAPTRGAAGRPGGAFLPDVFGGEARQIVEMAFGADLTADPDTWSWTDVTTDFLWEPGVNTIIGRPQESTRITPASFNGTIRNDQPNGGTYTVGNALSPRWPNIKENTPVRARLDVGNGPTVRFQGYAVSWKPVWDADRKMAVVRFQAAGVARRLLQGKSKPKSAIRRIYEESAPTPVGYWPLEDPSGSVVAASGIPDGYPMTSAGGSSSSNAINFGVSQGRTQGIFTGFEVPPVATDSFVSLAGGGSLTAALPPKTAGATTWTVEFIAFSWAYTGIAGTNLVLARWYTPGGSFVRWDVVQSSLTGGVELIAYNSAGAATTICATSFAPVDEYAYMIIVTQNGGNVDTTLWVARVITAGLIGEVDTDSRAGTLAFPSEIALNPDKTTASGTAAADNQPVDIRFGHLGVWHALGPYMFGVATSEDTGAVYGPWTGYVGESPTERLRRLARKASVPINIVGTSDIPMGMQPSAGYLDLCIDCETVDQGVLLDGLGPGLTYIARTSAYSKPARLTLDAGQGQVLGPVPAEQDDQGRINTFVASNPAGGERTFEKTTGDLSTADVGTYDSSGDFRVAEEATLYDEAAWQVHLGTVPGLRYPRISFELAKDGTAPLAQQWLDSLPYDRVDVLDLEPDSVDPDGEFLLRSWSERWNSKLWSVTANISPYAPWQIATLAATLGDDSDFLFRLTGGFSTVSTTVAPGIGFTEDFEDGVTGWTAGDCTFLSTASRRHKGALAGFMSTVGTPVQATVRSANIEVTPGVSISGVLWVNSGSGYASVYAAFDWYDSSFGYLSTDAIAPAALAANTWEKRVVTATVPAGAAYAQFGPTIGGNPPNGTGIFVDSVTVGPALVVATSASPFGVYPWSTVEDDVDGLIIDVDGIRIPVAAITSTTSPQTFTIDGTAVLRALPAGADVDVWQPTSLGL